MGLRALVVLPRLVPIYGWRPPSLEFIGNLETSPERQMNMYLLAQRRRCHVGVATSPTTVTRNHHHA